MGGLVSLFEWKQVDKCERRTLSRQRGHKIQCIGSKVLFTWNMV